MNKSPLQKVSSRKKEPTAANVITLLLRDHRALRALMKEVRSKRATHAQTVSSFRKLEKLVSSHVAAEEKALLTRIKDHPKFEHESMEGIEEHEIHRVVVAGIHQVSDPQRKLIRMKIFCEILEQHLDEEQEELFPKFKKYAALSTRKKIGQDFLKTRKATRRNSEKLGALAPRGK